MNILSKKTLSTIAFASLFTFASHASFAAADSVDNTSQQQVTKQQTKQHVINLNKSNLDELLTLKGIGQKKAQAILSYRKQVGSFASIEELTNVKGIGTKVIDDNKSRLQI